MKKLIIAIGILFLGFTAVSAQQAGAPDPNAPVITFDKDTFNLGNVPYGGNGNFEFKFTNTGKSDLVIKDVQRTCGCTSTDWVKEPVKPGQSGVVKVSYNTHIMGAFQKIIHVYSNASQPVVTLTFKGIVENNQTDQAKK